MAPLPPIYWCRHCRRGIAYAIKLAYCPMCERSADWLGSCPVPQKSWNVSVHDWCVMKALWINPERESRDWASSGERVT